MNGDIGVAPGREPDRRRPEPASLARPKASRLPTTRVRTAGAISGCESRLFNRLRRHFRATRVRLLHLRSKAAGCGLAVDDPGGGATSGGGFNVFKPLRRHFRIFARLAMTRPPPVAPRSSCTASRSRACATRAGQAYDAGPAADENSPPARFPVLAAEPGSARNGREEMLLITSAPRSTIFPRSVASARQPPLRRRTDCRRPSTYTTDSVLPKTLSSFSSMSALSQPFGSTRNLGDAQKLSLHV